MSYSGARVLHHSTMLTAYNNEWIEPADAAPHVKVSTFSQQSKTFGVFVIILYRRFARPCNKRQHASNNMQLQRPVQHQAYKGYVRPQ
jgi:hypothetical protein